MNDLKKFLGLAQDYQGAASTMDYSKEEVLIENINHDIDIYYDTVVFSMGQPARKPPLSISELGTIDWDYWVHTYAPKSTADLLLNAVKADLQNRKFDFTQIAKDIYQVTPLPIEIDGDPGDELLLQIDFPKIDATAWLVYDPDSGRFLESDIPLFMRNTWFERKILLLKDFTGDRRTDLIIHENFYVMGSFFDNYFVYQGSSTGLHLIDSYHEYTYAYDYDDEYDYDNDKPFPQYAIIENAGLPGLKITRFEGLSWGCSWHQTVTYRWPGGKEQKQMTGENAPRTSPCILAQAVSITRPVDSRTRLNLLSAIVNQFNLKDAEQQELAAFAHYRLALEYAQTGKDALARQQLQAVIRLYAKDPVTTKYLEEKFQPLLADKKLDILKICGAGYTMWYYSGDLFPIWREYSKSTYLYHSYPGGEPVPDAICPITSMVDEAIKNIPFDGEGSPEEAIKKAGLPVQSLQPYNLPGYNQPAWFAVLDTQPYILLAYVPGLDGYIWQRMDVIVPSSETNPAPPTWLNKDVTGDGIPELVIAFKSFYEACYLSKPINYQVHMTGNIGGQITSIGGYECMESPPDLEKLMADSDKDGLSDILVKRVKEMEPELFQKSVERKGPITWFTEEERQQMFSTAEDTPSTNLDPDAEVALFQGGNPADTRRMLERLRDGLSHDEPFYDNIIARCQYLIALSYEQEGNSAEAIRRYLALARAQPQTYWSILAAARLSPKEPGLNPGDEPGLSPNK